MRVVLAPAFILHRRPYRESSLLVEALSRDYGRVGLVARGASRPRARLKALLQPFQPLLLSWSGRGDLTTLHAAEELQRLPGLPAARLLSGFYLNELLIMLLARGDPCPELFAGYQRALAELAGDANEQVPLRRFEVELLARLGYGLQLTHEADNGRPLLAGQRYRYLLDRGPVPLTEAGPGIIISGQSLLALAAGEFGEPAMLQEVKQLTRAALAARLDKPLQSRAMIGALRRRTVPDDRI